MVTTWPKNFPGLGTGVNTVVKYINELSGGRLNITVYGSGELVPAFEVFDAVSLGAAEIGHSPSYYWLGKSQAAQFFTTLPFGMTAHEHNAWLYYGGGMDLWREFYEPFNLVPFPVGNTGVQMGGWFNKSINTIDDLQGLKIRMPGLAGEVLRRAGAIPVNMPNSEIFTALQTGAIDAAEWVSPYNDQAMGLQQAAQYYYYPGWQEPGPAIECIVNKEAWDSLPADLQAIIRVACQAAVVDMTSEFMARNAYALQELIDDGGVELREYPQSLLIELKRLTFEVVEELAENDPQVAKVWDSYREFMELSRGWQAISEQSYLETQEL
ncbi:MAG: ABC transporter substrate-binding protein [Rhodospirillaceae bacterium]|nr:ABC transporter substrate-binding protein [Rhodospirillaceae bacterium]